MLNRIIIMGRLVRDPELKRTQSGTAVTSLTIACERAHKDTNGNRETDFIDVVAWRNTAEFASKYFSKGRNAVVEGRLQVRSWTDKDGNKRRTAEILADNLYFADSRFSDSRKEAAPVAEQTTPGTFEEITEEDAFLPF